MNVFLLLMSSLIYFKNLQVIQFLWISPAFDIITICYFSSRCIVVSHCGFNLHLSNLWDQIANIHWTIGEAREFQKNIYFCFIEYAKAFDYVDHSKLWKILKDMGLPDHLSYLLRNLYASPEATVRMGHGTID